MFINIPAKNNNLTFLKKIAHNHFFNIAEGKTLTKKREKLRSRKRVTNNN